MSLKISDLEAFSSVTVGANGVTSKFQTMGSNTGGLAEVYVTAGGGDAFRLNTNFANGNYIDINPYITGVSNGGLEIKQNGTARFVITAGGNIGIGTTTDAGYKLDVNGTLRVSNVIRSLSTSNAGIEFGNSGSGGEFGFLKWDNTSNYLYLGHSYGGVFNKNLVINSLGNVGVSTLNPYTPFQVGSSNFNITNRISAVYGPESETIFTVGRSGIDYPQLLNFGVNQAGLYSTISARQFTVSTENNLVLQPNGGNVGIGTTSPARKLTIQSASTTWATAPSIAFYDNVVTPNARNWVVGNVATDYGSFNIASSTAQGGEPTASRLTINKDGNVGIGTTGPKAKLDVEAYTSFMSLSSGINSEATTADQQIGGIDFRKHYALAIGASIRLLQAGGPNNYSTSHLAFYTNDGGTAFNTVPPEKVRITSNGNLLVNTQTDSGYKLSVNGDGLFSGFSKSYTGNVNSDNYFEKVYQNFPNFPHNVANQAADIRFGNLSFWGYIEVEITGTYSNQSTSGKLTKVFSVGTNPGNLIYVNEARVVDAIGTIVDNIAIGDFSWDATNSVYRIPISHIVSTGNPYTVKVRMFTHSAGAWAAFNGITLSSNYTLAALPRQYPYYNNRLGIGTSTPTTALDLRGDLRVSGDGVNDGGLIGFGNYLNGVGYYDNAIYRSAFNSPTTPGNLLHISSYEALVFTTQAAQIGTQAIRMYINGSNGNITIGGNTDNGYKLQVNGGFYGSYFKGGDSGAGSVISNFVDTFGTSAMYVRGDRRVGIGATSLSEKLTVEDGSGSSLLRLNHTASSWSSTMLYGTTTATTGGFDFIGMYANGSAKFNVSSTGVVTASGGFFNSDIRLKDLVDYEYNVESIKPITYTWKNSEDKKRKIGYSAQDVQNVLPEAVKEDKEGFLSVDYIQVLVAKIAELENRIKQLEK